MEELNNLDDLLVLFPLEQDIKDTLVTFFTEMKKYFDYATDKYYNIKLPDNGYSELIQLFYYKSMGLEKLFENNQKFQFGLEMITKYLGEQENLFVSYLKEIAQRSYNRGIEKEYIESYITHYFEFALKKVFPNQESILVEVYKDFLDNQS
jgi:hypothetical protein